MSRLKSAATKNTDIDIADILGQKYRYRIDIGKGDIDPPQIDIILWSTAQCMPLLVVVGLCRAPEY